MILALAAGCDLSESFLAHADKAAPGGTAAPNGDRVVAGSLMAVTASTQASLRSVGIQAVASRQGEEVHLEWIDGAVHLSFVLTSVQTAQGESTRIHFQFAEGADQQAGLKVLADVEAKHGKAQPLPLPKY
jgi:hypothetical protein